MLWCNDHRCCHLYAACNVCINHDFRESSDHFSGNMKSFKRAPKSASIRSSSCPLSTVHKGSRAPVFVCMRVRVLMRAVHTFQCALHVFHNICFLQHDTTIQMFRTWVLAGACTFSWTLSSCMLMYPTAMFISYSYNLCASVFMCVFVCACVQVCAWVCACVCVWCYTVLRDLLHFTTSIPISLFLLCRPVLLVYHPRKA